MKLYMAFFIGAAIEAGLITILLTGGLGPCGPASSVGAFVLLLHVPGLVLTEGFHAQETLRLVIVALVYACAWSAVALLAIRAFQKR
jgi:hypothetical protein